MKEELLSKQSKLVAQGNRQEKGIDYDENPKKFDFANVKTASTPIETQKPLVKDEEASDVDVHLYRFQVTETKVFPPSAVKRIFRYQRANLKWVFGIRVSSFEMESYSDSDS
ncbi:hypothetical protein Tco_1031581 [Tanacetum coccineum]|uniref:Uncharacterized protein n=1 Tax=Tanacetum coccineum TaxID=301880 RepID=A0ABQ5G9W1_9ASTR